MGIEALVAKYQSRHRALHGDATALFWQVADNMLEARSALGESFYQVEWDMHPKTISNTMSLARAFPPDVRRPTLLKSHYDAIQGMPNRHEVVELLHKAATEGHPFTTEQIREMRGPKSLPPETEWDSNRRDLEYATGMLRRSREFLPADLQEEVDAWLLRE